PQMVTEQLDSMIDDLQHQPRQREPSDNDSNSSPDQDDSDPHQPDEPLDEPENEQEDDSQESPPESGDAPDNRSPQDEVFEVGSPLSIASLQVQPPDRRARTSTGRRAKTVSGSSIGRYVGARPPVGDVTDLALDATLRAAAPAQNRRRDASASSDGLPALLIEPWDVREKVRETKTGSLIIFVVDASGSMGTQRRMVAVKGAILSLLLDAYQRRDRVAMIAFRGEGADLLLPPTNSVDLAQVCLQEMPTGGRTPLSRGLLMGLEVVEAERMKDRDVLPLLVLLSDGRANVGLQSAETGQNSGASGGPAQVLEAAAEVEPVASLFQQQRIPSVVIDTETGFIRLELARTIAQAMDAKYLQLEDLRADNLAEAVRQELPGLISNTSIETGP
ncbi:MAG: hypothetical protein BZY80_05180, partial [SAR202 cluster bacterium Io17-Chloro-G2]